MQLSVRIKKTDKSEEKRAVFDNFECLHDNVTFYLVVLLLRF